jgi:hypothetical protein
VSSSEECELRIVRRSQYADAFRRYRIFANGKQVGTIARNEVLDIRLPSGIATIEATIDWGTSQPLRIELAPDKRTVVEVANKWGATLSLWAITFGRRSYLVLRERPTH